MKSVIRAKIIGLPIWYKNLGAYLPTQAHFQLIRLVPEYSELGHNRHSAASTSKAMSSVHSKRVSTSKQQLSFLSLDWHISCNSAKIVSVWWKTVIVATTKSDHSLESVDFSGASLLLAAPSDPQDNPRIRLVALHHLADVDSQRRHSKSEVTVNVHPEVVVCCRLLRGAEAFKLIIAP